MAKRRLFDEVLLVVLAPPEGTKPPAGLHSLLIIISSSGFPSPPPEPRVIARYPPSSWRDQPDTGGDPDSKANKQRAAKLARNESAVASFCFPDPASVMSVGKDDPREVYTFTLTRSDGGRVFGVCRRLPCNPTPRCLCLLAPWPWLAMYGRLLAEVEVELGKNATGVEEEEKQLLPALGLLKAAARVPFPLPGETFMIRIPASDVESVAGGWRAPGSREIRLTRPDDDESPLAGVPLSILLHHLSVDGILSLLAALLLEQRIVLIADNLSILSGCGHAALAALYPFTWQHVFIPVLPANLLSYVCAPYPFLIGVPSSVRRALEAQPHDDIVVFDLTLGTLTFPSNAPDPATLLPTPQDVLLGHSLRKVLARRKKQPARPIDEEAVRSAFLTFFLDPFAQASRYLSGGPEGRYDRDAFRRMQTRSVQRFLGEFEKTQMYEMFGREREEHARGQRPTYGAFDRESVLAASVTLQDKTAAKAGAALRGLAALARTARDTVGGKLGGLRAPSPVHDMSADNEEPQRDRAVSSGSVEPLEAEGFVATGAFAVPTVETAGFRALHAAFAPTADLSEIIEDEPHRPPVPPPRRRHSDRPPPPRPPRRPMPLPPPRPVKPLLDLDSPPPLVALERRRPAPPLDLLGLDEDEPEIGPKGGAADRLLAGTDDLAFNPFAEQPQSDDWNPF